MAYQLIPLVHHRFTDENGNVLSGGYVYFYVNETTTPADIYTDSDGLVAATNPQLLDAGGQLEDQIWIETDTLISIRVCLPDGTTIVREENNIGGYVTATPTPTEAQVIAALGYTPVDKAGDVMLGSLTLAADPSTGLMAASKQYVDNLVETEIAEAVSEFTAIVSTPTGVVLPTVSTVAPTGWLPCNGGVYDISAFPELAAILGTQYGGNGFTTFGVPDLRGEFIRGWDNGRGVDAGRNINTWQDHQFQDHSHTIKRAGADSATSSHSGTGDGSNVTGFAANGNRGAETRPRNIAMMYIIKT